LASSRVKYRSRIVSEESVGAVRFIMVSKADKPAGIEEGYMSRDCRFGKKGEELFSGPSSDS